MARLSPSARDVALAVGHEIERMGGPEVFDADLRAVVTGPIRDRMGAAGVVALLATMYHAARVELPLGELAAVEEYEAAAARCYDAVGFARFVRALRGRLRVSL